ncbi:CD4-1 molecule [Myxocyprinus asiaticus]|uniref:CD4-1 molecule n=1 Tax=Myxocyprinus asiaticus TaxID=70543 RepID=UPI0022238FC1|nr:CD4-1 molecule [Myxocyprinus asiaticus]
MLCWILISLLLQFLKAQEIPMIIYAQEGGTVTLPRDKRANEENVYVNWYYKSDSKEIISRNPQSGIQKGTWMRASLLPDFSLQISPVEDSDFEIFRCEQYVLMEKFTKTYRLYRVSIPKVPAVMVGASLTLNCEVEASTVLSLTTVTWIPPKNSACELRISYNKNKILVEEVPGCASGVWTCKVKYKRQEAEATTTVSVIDLAPSPPDPIYTSVSYHPSTVDIPCSLTSNIPWSILTDKGLLGGSWSFTSFSDQNNQTTKSLLSLSFRPTITWNVTNGAPITVQGRELKDQDLSIHKLPVSEKIRGVYTCSLKFTSNTLSRSVQVEVLQVTSSPSSREYEGVSVNLTCTLGNPMTSDLEVKWKCPSCSTLPSLSSSPHPASLSIPEVRLQNRGRWKCELWKNDKMLTSAELFLRIEKVPVDIWLWVAVSSGAVVFILLLVIVIIAIRRYKKMIMYRRRKTRFCCCKNPQPKGFYKT